MIDKKIMISGMTLEIVSDEGESWKCRNITTREPVFLKKTVLEDALKLAKAEVITDMDDNK